MTPTLPVNSTPTRWRWLRIALLALVPPLALAGWQALREPDRMAPPSSKFYLPSLLYDEFDYSAMALRGLNAELGRNAGWPTLPRGTSYEAFSASIEHPRPVKERYFLEYPHTALLLFRAGYWVQPGWRDLAMPPGLPDCGYHNLAGHSPETDGQFAFWRVFVVATSFYACIMFAAWIALILVLEWGYGAESNLQGGTLLLLLPGALFFALNRFDVLPALATALAFAALGRRRVALAAVCLGAATLLKVYPVLFAPIIVRYLWPRPKEAIRFLAVYVAMGLFALHPLLLGEDFTGIVAPYKFQLTRPPEIGLTIYGCLLPADLADGPLGSSFRLASLAAMMAWMLATPVADLAGVLRRSAMILMVFVGLAVFYSPQWIVWFIPLLGPLIRRHRWLGCWHGLLDAVNYITFPMWFFVLPELAVAWVGESSAGPFMMTLGNVLRYVRFGVCGLVLVHLAESEFSAGKRLVRSLARRWPQWPVRATG